FPGAVRLTFLQPLLLSTASGSDLTVNGAPATGVTVIDARTVDFNIAGLNAGDGTYTVQLAAGAVTDLAGNASSAYTATFRVDATAPVVAASSVSASDVVAAGDLTYTATFSEDLAVSGLGTEDITLVNTLSGQAIPATSFAYDPANRRITVGFHDLVDSNYTL